MTSNEKLKPIELIKYSKDKKDKKDRDLSNVNKALVKIGIILEQQMRKLSFSRHRRLKKSPLASA